MDNDRSARTPVVERRRAKRHAAVDFVWYKVLPAEGEDPASSPEGVSKMCDISKTGIGIYATQRLPLGSAVFIELGANKFSMSAVGTVVSEIKIKENYYRTGIHFKIIPPNDRMTLAKFMKSHDKV